MADRTKRGPAGEDRRARASAFWTRRFRLDSLRAFRRHRSIGGAGGWRNAARARDWGPWLNRVAAQGEVFVRFWLRPGEAAVTPGMKKEQREARIPVQLKPCPRVARWRDR